MSKRKLYTIGGSVSCGLFFFAIVLFVVFTNRAVSEFVALDDEAMEHLTGGVTKPHIFMQPAFPCDIALCPFLGDCDTSWKTCGFLGDYA